MSIEKVKAYLEKYGYADKIIEHRLSTSTVELAARALNVVPGRIAKTLSFKKDNFCILIVCAGDVRIDNKKFKSVFESKAKMLSPADVIEYTGHAIGGVCPFGIENENVSVYTDVSLKKYSTVFPACGSSNSAIELTCDELFVLSKSKSWIDVCK